MRMSLMSLSSPTVLDRGRNMSLDSNSSASLCAEQFPASGEHGAPAFLLRCQHDRLLLYAEQEPY